MKKNRILLIFIIIIIIVVILLSIYLSKLKNNKDKKIEEEGIDSEASDAGGYINGLDIEDENTVTNGSNKEEEVTDISELKEIEQCIQKYFDMLNTESTINFDRNGNRILTDEQLNNIIIDMLDQNYKTKNNIDSSNLNKYIEKFNKKYMVVSLKMRKLKDSRVEKYLTYGLLVDTDYKETKKFCVYTNIDTLSATFSIEPLDANSNNYDDIKIENDNSEIVANDNNEIEFSKMNSNEIAEEYYMRNKILSLSNPEIAYNYLDEDYKNKKFENYDNYKKYIEDNYDTIKQLGLSKFKTYNDGTYTEYVCIDQNNNYFIIDQESALHYRIFLDSYTVDDSEFKDKYDKGDNQTKGGMNIEKIKMALNAQDYNYVYNKLDSTFKKNNFDTIEKFEDYCKDNFYSSCDFEYVNYEEKGNGIYTFQVQMTSDDEGNNDVKNITFIMQLKDDRDFVMSFNFN